MSQLKNFILMEENELQQGAELLQLSFKDDSQFQKLFTHEKNPDKMTQLFYFILKSGLKEGGIFIKDSPEMNGVAMLIPAGIPKKTFAAFSFTAFARLLFTYKFKTIMRLMTLAKYMMKIHKRIIPRQHYYLSIIGVNPKYQGQGIGKKLLLSINNAMDQKQMPIYLETQNKKNVSIYNKYGFQVVHKERMEPVLKNEFYFMLREPQ